MDNLFLTREEVAKVYKVSTDTVDKLASNGWLNRLKIGARTVFAVKDVVNFASELERRGLVSLIVEKEKLNA